MAAGGAGGAGGVVGGVEGVVLWGVAVRLPSHLIVGVGGAGAGAAGAGGEEGEVVVVEMGVVVGVGTVVVVGVVVGEGAGVGAGVGEAAGVGAGTDVPSGPVMPLDVAAGSASCWSSWLCCVQVVVVNAAGVCVCMNPVQGYSVACKDDTRHQRVCLLTPVHLA